MPAIGSFGLFCDAVSHGLVEPLSVAFEPEAEQAMRKALSQSGLLLLGECHGVGENPLIIHALVERFAIDVVALEWPSGLSGVLGRFLAHGVLEDHPLLWLGDGRVTAQHLAVFKASGWSSSGLVLIDRERRPHGDSWSDRDHDMASGAIAASAGERTVLVVAGNAHTPVADAERERTMGAWIAAARPGVQHVVIQYGSGGFFNFGEHTFGDGFAGETDVSLSYRDGDLILRLPRASSATVLYAGTRSVSQLRDTHPRSRG